MRIAGRSTWRIGLGTAQMWTGEPRSTGDSRVDAAFAAMAEYLARRDGWTLPAWARLSRREAWPWWFVTGLGREDIRALLDELSAELSARGARAELFRKLTLDSYWYAQIYGGAARP